MIRSIGFCLVLFVWLGPALADEPGALFTRVAEVLEEDYHNQDLIREKLPFLIRTYGPLARGARDLMMERKIIHAFLSELPSSHLALLSKNTYNLMIQEMDNKKHPTFGFSLLRRDGMYFVHNLLIQGPAHEAGLLRWDRIVEVNGVPTHESPLLDWRSDDAHLPDPPVHELICENGEKLDLLVERHPEQFFKASVTADKYSAWQSTKASCGVISRKNARYGYMHFHYIHNNRINKFLLDKIKNEFKDCEGLILDLRGRGGNTAEMSRIIHTLKKKWCPRPLVALTDRGTRSAKEIIAYIIKRDWMGLVVGQRTAGAVLPASFKKVGEDSVLMYTAHELGRISRAIEKIGVHPDILKEDAGPYSAGADPILEQGIKTLEKKVRRF